MCFRKKKVEPIVSKFKKEQLVQFRDKHGDLTVGYVYDVKKGKDGKIYYDIQVGGECPYINHDILEDKIF